MTSTQHGPMSTPGSQAPLVPSSGRVSILVGESHQIDVVLPAAVPLAALLDPAREAVNREMRARGEEELPHGSYEFVRAVGMTVLSGDASLAAQGVLDGDLLALVPAGAGQRYGPNIENVSTALARWAKDHFPAVSAARRGAGRGGVDRRRAGGGGAAGVADALGRRPHGGAPGGVRRGGAAAGGRGAAVRAPGCARGRRSTGRRGRL